MAPRVEAILAERAGTAEVRRFRSRRQAAVWLGRAIATVVVDDSVQTKEDR